MKNLSSLAFATVALLSLAGAARAQSEAVGVALTTEEATVFIKGKSLSATRLAGGTPSLQFKDNGTMYGQKTITTAAAVIRGSGGLKTASCACAGSGGNTKAAASWFGWKAKSITFTRMPARYT